MRISDQMIPVRICTDATCETAMLSSVLPNSRGLTRLTCSGLTTMRVGKIRLPRVHRLAENDSPAGGPAELCFISCTLCALGMLFYLLRSANCADSTKGTAVKRMIDPENAAKFQPHLMPAQNLLWTGRPKFSKICHSDNCYMVPFSLLWGFTHSQIVAC